jgi:hypothetical protein
MMPKYLPGDILRTGDGNLWLVVYVIPTTPIYTLHAQSSLQYVSVTRTGRELEQMHPVKVTRMPEDIRTEGIAETLAALDQNTDREAALTALWNLAFTTGLAAIAAGLPGAVQG